MLLKSVEVERERRDQERRGRDEQERERHLRKTWSEPAPSTRAASVSSSGTACSAAVHTRNQYGKPSQTLTRMQDTFAQVGSKSQGMSVRQRLVDDPELVVQQPLPDEDGEERRDREREHEQRALDAPQLQRRLVQRDREERGRARTG